MKKDRSVHQVLRLRKYSACFAQRNHCNFADHVDEELRIAFDLQTQSENHRMPVSTATGSPMSQFDAMIAAITRVHRATLATRNVRDCEGCGIRLVNPWVDVH